MSSNLSNLSNDELILLISGVEQQPQEEQPQQDQNLVGPIDRFLQQATGGRASLSGPQQAQEQQAPVEVSQQNLGQLSDQQLLQFLGGQGVDVSKGRPLTTGESIAAGVLEGITDPFAIAEFAAEKLAPEKPEGLKTAVDVESEILGDRDISELSFMELFAISDSDEPLPPSFFGPTAKQKEEAPPEALAPFRTFQAGIPESEDEIARILRRGTRFATGAAATGAGLGTAAEIGALGLAGQTAREAGVGEIPATIIELGGVGAARNLLRGKFKRSSFPKAMEKDILQTAERLNLRRLPASATRPGGAVNFVENLTQQSVFGKKAYEKLFNEIQEGLTTNLENQLNDISRRRFTSLAEGGETLQNAFVNAHSQARAFSRAFYGFAEQAAQGIKVPVSDLQRGLDRLSKRLGQTFVQEGKEAGVKSIVDGMRKALKREADSAGRVPLERLIAQRRSIRSMINYEDVGGAREFLKGVDRSLTNTFERVGRQNPEWFRRFREAERNFADQAKFFRNKLMKNVLFNESPEGIMNAINKPSDIAKLENAIKVKGINSQTRQRLGEVVDAVKRRKVEDILMDRVTDANGKVALSKRDVIPKNQKDFISKLLSKEGRQVVKDIDRIRKVVAEAGSKFANTSRSFANAQDVGIMVTSMNALLTGNLPLLATTAVPAASYFVASKALTSPTIAGNLLKLERAALRNNATEFNRIATALSAEFNDILRENNIDKSQVAPEGFEL